jgi:leucyl-tRNA synthetase
MELVNAIYIAMDNNEIPQKTIQEAINTVILLLSPFVPHISEELWQKIGKTKNILKESWPSYEGKMQWIINEVCVIPVQINGKLRSKVNVRFGTDQETLKEKVLADEKIKKYIGTSKPKFIIIPNKLVNVVISKK